MLSKLARGAYILLVGVMVLAWAVSVSKSKPTEPKPDQQTEYWYL